MIALLVDLGNTRIKWARLTARGLGAQHAAAHAGWSEADFRRRLFGGAAARKRGAAARPRLLAVSVAASAVHRRFLRAARSAGYSPEVVAPLRRAGGVTNGYREVWRLGADRWVALIGAHALEPRARARCVVDVGTAVTIDLLDARGRHRGGAIIPGPDLMVASLLAGTGGIRRRAGHRVPQAASLFARGTQQGLVGGARHAVAGVIDRAMLLAQAHLRGRPELILTGGAAPGAARDLWSPYRLVPDLVLRGLAALAASS